MKQLLQDPNSIAYYASQHSSIDSNLFLSWIWQMNHQIRHADQAAKWHDINATHKAGFEANQDLFEIGITPYYAMLSQIKCNSDAVALQAFPSPEEQNDPHGKEDPLHESHQSPVKEVVHIYPDRVAFCVAQLCPVYCRYCFRKRRDSEIGLHFHPRIIKQGLEYIASQKSIRDVLITGGDPFLATDQTLESLLIELKKIPHIKLIRFGTRTPVTLPYRITDTLVNMLAKYHPIWINTHFNCSEEITSDAALALKILADAGICLGNQSVLLRGVNDSEKSLIRLCTELTYHRVRPYYLFHANNVAGTQHLRVPISKGLKLVQGLRGKISGFAIPSYILDTPSGKIPLNERSILGVDGHDVLIQDNHNRIHRETQCWSDDGFSSPKP